MITSDIIDRLFKLDGQGLIILCVFILLFIKAAPWIVKVILAIKTGKGIKDITTIAKRNGKGDEHVQFLIFKHQEKCQNGMEKRFDKVYGKMDAGFKEVRDSQTKIIDRMDAVLNGRN